VIVVDGMFCVLKRPRALRSPSVIDFPMAKIVRIMFYAANVFWKKNWCTRERWHKDNDDVVGLNCESRQLPRSLYLATKLLKVPRQKQSSTEPTTCHRPGWEANQVSEKPCATLRGKRTRTEAKAHKNETCAKTIVWKE